MRRLVLLLVISALAGCSKDTTTPPPPLPLLYSIGGDVTGLAGSGLVLQNNGGDDLAVSEGGSFAFATALASGASYAVTVAIEPSNPSQACAVAGDTGTVGNADVTSIAVECVTRTFTVGGTVTGLVGSGLVLQNNGGDDLAVGADGGFTFATALVDLSSYAVTVLSQPATPSQTCAVSGGGGDLAGADVADISVTCTTDTFAVGGTVSGLVGTGLVLQNNGADDLPVDANGAFVFASELQEGATYEITVGTNPTDEICFVSSGSGTVGLDDVTDVLVECGPDLGAVAPLYSNGTGWTYFVENDGPNSNEALDNACTGSNDGYFSCIHGGEKRVVSAPMYSSCANLTPTDTLMAFDWSCLDAGGSVRFVSEGLRDDRGLTDLIDFDAIAWRPLALRVWNDSGSIVAATQPVAWWSNPVVAADDSDGNSTENLDTEGTVYVITQDPTAAFTVTADHIALAVRPGVVAAGDSVGANVSVQMHDFLWFEGEFDPNGGYEVMHLDEITFSVLRNLRGANTGGSVIAMENADNNFLWNITANGSSGQVGLSIWQSNWNAVQGLRATGNLQGGLRVSDSYDNVIDDVFVSGSSDHGILISQGVGNQLRWVVSVENDLNGIEIRSAAESVFLHDVTVASNGWAGIRSNGVGVVMHGVRASNNGSDGIVIVNGFDHALTKILAVSNGSSGIMLETARNAYLSYVTAANNGNAGVLVGDTSVDTTLNSVLAINNAIAGIDAVEAMGLVGWWLVAGHGDTGVRVGAMSAFVELYGFLKADGASFDCWVAADAGTGGGLDDDAEPAADDEHEGLCVPDTPSVLPTPVTVVDATATFVGKATADSANADGPDGTRVAGEIDDWSTFERAYRAWGRDGATDLFASDQRGPCAGELCRIWDYNLATGDTVAFDLFATPTGNDILVHTWSNNDVPAILAHATEIFFDGVGNENGLCEAGENCMTAPNVGAYQGHGAGLGIAGTTTGSVSGVSLWERASNGY